MAEVDRIAAQFRADVEARSARAVGPILDSYRAAWKQLENQAAALATELAQARDAGLPSIVPTPGSGASAASRGAISASKASQLQRLRAIQKQISERVNDIGRNLNGTITDEQAQFIQMADDHARALGTAGLDASAPGLTFDWLSADLSAVEAQIGYSADGSPLRNLTGRLGAEASQQITNALITGIATGQNPAAVARAMRTALAGNAVRAERIARTEMLRSYREATHLTYLANSDVVNGWYWLAARQPRTCASCWAMSGTFHSLEEKLASHINCRCAMVPGTKTWDELGIRGARSTANTPKPGADVFADLSPTYQLAVLGPAKYQAYSAGELQLTDFVTVQKSAEWGASRNVATLAQARANAIRRARGVDTTAIGKAPAIKVAEPARVDRVVVPGNKGIQFRGSEITRGQVKLTKGRSTRTVAISDSEFDFIDKHKIGITTTPITKSPPSTVAFYASNPSGFINNINIKRVADPQLDYVFFHEFGHAIDFNHGTKLVHETKVNQALQKTIDKEAKAVVKQRYITGYGYPADQAERVSKGLPTDRLFVDNKKRPVYPGWEPDTAFDDYIKGRDEVFGDAYAQYKLVPNFADYAPGLASYFRKVLP